MKGPLVVLMLLTLSPGLSGCGPSNATPQPAPVGYVDPAVALAESERAKLDAEMQAAAARMKATAGKMQADIRAAQARLAQNHKN